MPRVCESLFFHSDTFLDLVGPAPRGNQECVLKSPKSLHCARVIGALAAAVWNAAFVFDVPARPLHVVAIPRPSPIGRHFSPSI